MDAEVDAPVVVEPRRPEGLAGQVAPRELGPEAGVLAQPAGGDVVGMRVVPIRSKDITGPRLPQDARQLAAGFEGVLQAAVGQAQVLPPGEAQGLAGGTRFGGTAFGRAVGRRFAVGQVEDPHAEAAADRADDGPPDADFGVIRVGGDNQDVQRGFGKRACGTDLRKRGGSKLVFTERAECGECRVLSTFLPAVSLSFPPYLFSIIAGGACARLRTDAAEVERTLYAQTIFRLAVSRRSCGDFYVRLCHANREHQHAQHDVLSHRAAGG